MQSSWFSTFFALARNRLNSLVLVMMAAGLGRFPPFRVTAF